MTSEIKGIKGIKSSFDVTEESAGKLLHLLRSPELSRYMNDWSHGLEILDNANDGRLTSPETIHNTM